MSSYGSNPTTPTASTGHDTDHLGTHLERHDHADTSETKPSFKTTELIAYVVVAIAVLIAAAVTDNGNDGQGFSADHAWFYVTLLTIGYLISRGLAKSGSYAKDDSKKSTRR
jgi:hypothetical protein